MKNNNIDREAVHKMADEMSEKYFEKLLEGRKNKIDFNVKTGLDAINETIKANTEIIESMMRVSEEVTKKISTDLTTQFIVSSKILIEVRKNLVNAIQRYEPAYANLLAIKILIEREGSKNEQN